MSDSVSAVSQLCVYRSGQSSAVADFNLLDTARKVELYGVQMYPAKVLRRSFSLKFSRVTLKEN